MLQRVRIEPPGGPIELEAELIGAGARLIVFLHEGLGSLAAWGGWPRTLCAAAGCRGLVFSRYGYGRSQRRPPGQEWPSDYLGIANKCGRDGGMAGCAPGWRNCTRLLA
jgi:pimeloyl-ACP methyl ester carboxylesterase